MSMVLAEIGGSPYGLGMRRNSQGRSWMKSGEEKRKGALSSALLRAKRSVEVTANVTSNVLLLALGNAAGLDLPPF
jgi:uncharacterized membrane protein YebE (DUF533 family)